MATHATHAVKKTNPIKKPVLDFDELIPDELIKHNPINLPNNNDMIEIVLAENLPEHTQQTQENRRNNIQYHNKRPIHNGFNSKRKKQFLKTLLERFGNKTQACVAANVNMTTIHYTMQSESSMYDPVFAYWVRTALDSLWDGCEENLVNNGIDNPKGFIASFGVLRAKRPKEWGNQTTIAYETVPQLGERKKAKAIDLAEFTETRELTSPDEKQE